MKITKVVWLMVLLGVSLLPVVAMAAAPHIGIGGLTGPFITCSGNPIQSGIPGCTSLCDVVSTFQNILYFAVNLALFVLAPIMFIYGAVQVFMGAANESLISKGKSIILDTVIGLVIVFASFAIINTFFYMLGTKLGGGDGNVSWPNISCNGESLPGYVKPSFYNTLPIPGQVANPTAPTNPNALPTNTSQANCINNCNLPNKCVQDGNSYSCKAPTTPIDISNGVPCPDSDHLCASPNVCRPQQLVTTVVYNCVDPKTLPSTPSADAVCKTVRGNLPCPAPKRCVYSDVLKAQTCEDPL